MISINRNHQIDALDLYNLINPRTPYHKWIKRCISTAELREGQHYYIVQKESTGGRPGRIFLITVKTAQLLCIMSFRFNKQAMNVYRYLSNLYGKEVAFHYPERKEVIFLKDLQVILENITCVRPQYIVGKYRIDYYIPEFKLAIEYDEPYHEKQKELDNQREAEITKALGCKFVRVPEGGEAEAINTILMTILYWAYLKYEDGWLADSDELEFLRKFELSPDCGKTEDDRFFSH